MNNPTPSEPSYIKRSLRFLFDYFRNSEHKKKAWLLLIGGTLSALVVSGLGFALGGWFLPFIYAAFIAKDFALLLMGMGAGLLLAGGMAGFSYLANYLKNKLYVDWRSWLTKKIINKYLKGKTNYLEISRNHKDLDNPEQRIQEDVDKVVESFLSLTLGFIENVVNLTIYLVLLGITGGALSFVLGGATLVIPGYLVLVALLAGVTTSLIGYFISKPLKKLANDETKTQSDLRTDLHQLKNSAEEIAIEHAEQYYQNRLNNGVDELNKKTKKRLSIQNGTTAFNLFTNVVQLIVPILAAVPLFFSSLITLDAFYSTSYYFTMVTFAINWFINSFELINKFKTSLSRILALQNILEKNSDTEAAKISRKVDCDNENLVVNALDLHLHSGSEVVIKGLDLKFTRGIHTLIQAPSGTGKSSLFKAIAGTWLAGEGEIIIPNSLESIYFLPQKPTLPDDTLRNVLAYPDAHCPYSDDELITALKAVNMDVHTTKLDEKVGFKSLGEQQRIAFARVLLRKPDWVFLDEATASLDEEREEQVYCRIKELLPKTTIISIAHRSTVKRYHDNVLFFKVNAKKEAQVEEERITMGLGGSGSS